MDQSTFDEIVSILAKCGRPDLISECVDHIKIDNDYKPTFVRRDSLSDNEGSAEEESDYSVEEDDEGFQSLK
jgi:hypothetical protein